MDLIGLIEFLKATDYRWLLAAYGIFYALSVVVAYLARNGSPVWIVSLTIPVMGSVYAFIFALMNAGLGGTELKEIPIVLATILSVGSQLAIFTYIMAEHGPRAQLRRELKKKYGNNWTAKF